MSRTDQNNRDNMKRIRVQGMHCASCVARVEKAIRSVPGVQNAEVNLIMEEATITGEAEKGAVVQAIRDAGYEADEDDEDDPDTDPEPDPDPDSYHDPHAAHNPDRGGDPDVAEGPLTETSVLSDHQTTSSAEVPGEEVSEAKDPGIVWLEIQGMFCASCVGRVEKELLKVKGVSDAEINLITGEARVEFAGTDTGLLVEAAKRAGYDAVEKNGSGRDAVSADDAGSGVRSDIGTRIGTGKVTDTGPETASFSKTGTDTETGTESDTDTTGSASSSVTKPGKRSAGKKRKTTSAGFMGMSFRRRFFIALPLGLLVMLMEMVPMVIEPLHHFVQANRFGWNLAVLALTSVILFYPGAPFFVGAWKMARRFTADMNTLVAVGTGAAWGFSTYATFFGREGGLVTPNDVYFDTAAVIIALILLGRWMEERAKHRTRGAIESLLELTPKTANRLTGGSGIETVSIKQIKRGDLLLVKSYEQVPVDGEVTDGAPLIDESMMTGESVPVPKSEGDAVTGGTMNTSDSFRMRATRVGADTALAGIIETVRRAQSSKAPIQRLVDKVASVFVPIVLVIAIITLGTWIATGTLQEGIVNMVAVLLIACPCALGLATPTGIMVGSGRAAEKGILIKDAVTLEEAKSISVVLFDKTGTLTEGRMRVTEVRPAGGMPERDLLKLAAAVELETDHPIAKAVVEKAKEVLRAADSQAGKDGLAPEEGHTSEETQTPKVGHTSEKGQTPEDAHTSEKGNTPEDAITGDDVLPTATSVKTVRGFGVTGVVDGKEVTIAAYDKADLGDEGRAGVIRELEEKGATVLSVTIDGDHGGYLAVADTLRQGAADVVRDLRDMGIQTVMVTGDRERPARAVAEALGIDRVEFEVKPDEKAAIVRKYRGEGRHVAMAGDGINDAAALVEADLGIAMSTGTDLAMSSADVTILGGDLSRIPETIRFSGRVLRVIRQNLFWAFVYNTVGIPLAAFGFLSPMFAAAAMALSSVSVVGNSLRIR